MGVVYQFACRRIDRFRYGRVLFAGDAAHQVSPFGARGANTGVQDVDNLAWKLKLVLDGAAPVALLDWYHEERAFAADDNLPIRPAPRLHYAEEPRQPRFRDAVLELAEDASRSRARWSTAGGCPRPRLTCSPRSTLPDEDMFAGAMRPGTNCADAPVNTARRDLAAERGA